MVSGELSAVAYAGARRSKYRTFAAGRTLESGANFRKADAQFRHGAAKRVAVDSQLLGRLALVTPVCGQYLAQILPLEFTHGIFVAYACGVHLCYQAVQVSSHVNLLLY